MLAALALAGCGPGPGERTAASDKSVWDHFSVKLDGHAASLQLAVLPDEQQRGLMQRPDLGRDEGMIFVDARPHRLSFWMRNTPEPLDVAFLSPEGEVAEIYPLLPLDERAVSSHGDQLQMAIEMPSGWFASHGIHPGSRVDMAAVKAALKDRGFDPARFKF